MAKLNNSLCAVNNLIFAVRICKILKYQFNEYKINKDLVLLNNEINQDLNNDIRLRQFAINGLKRDDMLFAESTQKFNRYLTYTLITNIICSATSIAICSFVTNRLMATVINTGLTVANASSFLFGSKYFPKLQNSCGFVEKDVSNINAKKFYYHLSTHTLVPKRVQENCISADDDGNIVYNHAVDNKATATRVSLHNYKNNQSKFNITIKDIPWNIKFDKLGCIKAGSNDYNRIGCAKWI